MTTPARRSFQRAQALKRSQADQYEAPVNANAYELMLIRLNEDKRRLKDVKSIERKIEVKRGLLPEYAAWIDGALERKAGVQDDVLMTAMVWRLDTGDFPGALAIAEHAIANKLAMPDQYQRDVATVVAEEIADQAIQAVAAGNADFPLAALEHAERITRDQDMPDEVRAKLHKALAQGLEAGLEAAPDTAENVLHHYRRALQLHERVGVKKDIERIERLIKNTLPPAG